MEDRRAEVRHPLFKQARIAFNERQSLIDCALRNLSGSGACLEVVDHAGVPSNFELLIEGDDASRQCFLVWRSDNRIGVEFIENDAHAFDEGGDEQAPDRRRATVPD
jgi:PilZ domain